MNRRQAIIKAAESNGRMEMNRVFSRYPNPTPEQVQEANAAYWRCYYSMLAANKIKHH